MKKDRHPKKKSMKDFLTKKERQELRKELDQMSKKERKYFQELADHLYEGDIELALQRYKVWSRPAIFLGWNPEKGKWDELKG